MKKCDLFLSAAVAFFVLDTRPFGCVKFTGRRSDLSPLGTRRNFVSFSLLVLIAVSSFEAGLCVLLLRAYWLSFFRNL